MARYTDGMLLRMHALLHVVERVDADAIALLEGLGEVLRRLGVAAAVLEVHLVLLLDNQGGNVASGDCENKNKPETTGFPGFPCSYGSKPIPNTSKSCGTFV